MKYLKLTAVPRAGRLLPLLTILIFVHVDQSTSNIQTQNDSKDSSNLAGSETVQPHPTVVYKEDFVREDYDMFKSKTKEHARRKLKQNKVFFDMLPKDPILIDDTNDIKLNISKLQVDIIPLVEDQPLHRQRRNSEDSHAVRKRNPYLNYYVHQYPSSNQLQVDSHPYNYPRRQPVQGILWNGIDRPVPTSAPLPMFIGNRFGNDDEEDRVIWDRYRPVQNSVPRATAPPSIFHDSNPANADFGFMNRRPQTSFQGAQTTRPTTVRPSSTRPPSIFHDSNPANADTSFITRRPVMSQTNSVPQRGTTTTSVAAGGVAVGGQGGRTEPPITACVWAIVNCCSNRDQNVRYFCFENHGCSGSFFDLNPCGDFKNRVIEYIGGVIN